MPLYNDYQNASLDLFVDQGSTFEQTINLKNDIGEPLDLTGNSLTIQVKKYYNTTRLFPAIVSIIGDPLLGRIKIAIPSTTTSSMDSERYVYKVVSNASTTPVTVLDGQILIDRF